MNLFSIVSASAVGIFSAVILTATVPFPSRFSSCTVVFTTALTQPRLPLSLLNECLPFAGWSTMHSSDFADLVVRNATIFTSDSTLPFAEAMAVRNGRILRLGSYSSIQDLVSPKTLEVNLERKVVVPGFIDSHVHFLNGGLQMLQVQLQKTRSQYEFVRNIKQAVEGKCKGCWILGGGWNNDFMGGIFPSSSWIDDITPNNPVWLYRTDGHMGLANRFALKMAKITNETKDPIGGTVLRSSDGEPTGVLVDTAMKLVVSLIPEISIDERRRAFVRASRHALSRGVTTVVDFGRFLPGGSVVHVWQDFSDVYKWANSINEVFVRVSLFFPMQTWPSLVDLVKKNGKALSENIYLGGVKTFADGSLGSRSALFYEAYVNEPDNYGLLVMDPVWLLNATSASDRSGLQIAIHAIGDKANVMILDLYDSIVSLNGLKDRRFRVEHAQHLASGTVARFGKQGVIASVQPQHLLDDADSAEEKIGAHRANTGSYLFQSILNSGGQLAFGSDWPVSDINPLEAIKTATTRIPPGWKSSWNAAECISLDDAIMAFTISAAHASFLDSDLGSLSTGKFADFVVLSAGSWEEFSKNPSQSLLATYVSGVQAYP